MTLPPFDAEKTFDALPGIAYAVDLDGIVVAVTREAWADFATDNNAEALAADGAVVGRSLAEFMVGQPRALCETLLRMARHGDIPSLSYQFRCDAPGIERDMRMAVRTIVDSGRALGLVFQSSLFEERAGALPGLDVAEPGDITVPILRVCSYCKQVEAADGMWLGLAPYERSGGRLRVRLSHGICPDCGERLTGLMDRALIR